MRTLDFEWYDRNVDQLKTSEDMINALHAAPSPAVNFLSQEMTKDTQSDDETAFKKCLYQLILIESSIIIFVHETILNDREFVLECVRKNGDVLNYMNNHILQWSWRSDIELFSAAISTEPELISLMEAKALEDHADVLFPQVIKALKVLSDENDPYEICSAENYISDFLEDNGDKKQLIFEKWRESPINDFVEAVESAPAPVGLLRKSPRLPGAHQQRVITDIASYLSNYGVLAKEQLAEKHGASQKRQEERKKRLALQGKELFSASINQ